MMPSKPRHGALFQGRSLQLQLDVTTNHKGIRRKFTVNSNEYVGHLRRQVDRIPFALGMYR